MKFGLPSACLGLVLALGLRAEEGKGTDTPDGTLRKPEVERISETSFRIGKVSFDSAKREISFPAKVNMTEGLLEYAVVMPHGKMHESLFVSEANPFDLNVALKLLGVKVQTRYFPELDENFTPIPAPPLKEEELKPSLIAVVVSWKKGEQSVCHPLHKLIRNVKTEQSLPSGRWLYTGSVVDHGKFQATVSGDLLAIFNNRASIINFAGDGADDDTIWVPHLPLLPEIGTDVVLTLKIAPQA